MKKKYFDDDLEAFMRSLRIARECQKERDFLQENIRIRKQARIDVAFLTEMEQKLEAGNIGYVKRMIRDWKAELRRKFKRVPKAVQEKKTDEKA